MPRITIGLLAVIVTAAGCASEPPPRIAVPDRVAGNPYATVERDPVKPMPAERAESTVPPPPADPPQLNQRPPEQAAFVAAYERVGRPHIALTVNPQLKGGSPDELAARAIDYGAMEANLAAWFSANGRVVLISPAAARERLNGPQLTDLQSGDEKLARQAAEQLPADVLVQVQVQPANHDGQPALRIVSTAVNVRGGESLARAVADVPPTLQRLQIDTSIRSVAQKLMDDMAMAWSTMPLTAPATAASQNAPSTAPKTSPSTANAPAN